MRTTILPCGTGACAGCIDFEWPGLMPIKMKQALTEICDVKNKFCVHLFAA
jgi:hypothetical protein